MQNTEENRLKLADAIWEAQSLDAIHEQFIFQLLERYKTDQDAFEEDSALMGFDQ